jgi:hypothetical protein
MKDLQALKIPHPALWATFSRREKVCLQGYRPNSAVNFLAATKLW